MAGPTAGLIELKVDGRVYSAKGNFTYNAGVPLREAILGSDGVHGFKETPQAPFIEGEVTDRGDLDLISLASITDATVVLKHGNGKLFMLTGAYYAGDGTGTTEESNVAVRFEGDDAEEVS